MIQCTLHCRYGRLDFLCVRTLSRRGREWGEATSCVRVAEGRLRGRAQGARDDQHRAGQDGAYGRRGQATGGRRCALRHQPTGRLQRGKNTQQRFKASKGVPSIFQTSWELSSSSSCFGSCDHSLLSLWRHFRCSRSSLMTQVIGSSHTKTFLLCCIVVLRKANHCILSFKYQRGFWLFTTLKVLLQIYNQVNPTSPSLSSSLCLFPTE